MDNEKWSLINKYILFIQYLIAFKVKHGTIPTLRDLSRNEETILIQPESKGWCRENGFPESHEREPLEGFEESEQAPLRTDNSSYSAIQTKQCF